MTLQAQYSLVVRDLEREHVPLCRRFGLGILPWSPLAGGFLTGKYREGPSRRRPASRLDEVEGALRALRQRAQLADPRRGARGRRARSATTPPPVALAWLLAKPAVTLGDLRRAQRRAARRQPEGGGGELPPTQMQEARRRERVRLGYPYDFFTRIQKRW